MCRVADTVLFWRGGWPTPICGARGEHAFDRYLTDYVCAFCGAQVMPEDTQALEAWWTNYHRHTILYERN